MLSVLKNIWNTFDWKRNQQNIQEEFDKEQRYLDAAIEKENEIKQEKNEESSVFDVQKQNEIDNAIAFEQGKCFKRTGKISSLSSTNGTIDNYIYFDFEDAPSIFNELKVGNTVEFIAYESANNELTKIVKILQSLDQHWDHGELQEKDLQAEIENLKNEKPTYFTMLQRTILGLIIDRHPETITIETENTQKVVNLDDIEIDFSPQEGDRVYVHANVRYDDDYVDKFGEILEITKVHPTRILKQERCTVKCVNNLWGILNEDIYYVNDNLPTKVKLNEGDIVEVDLIECARGQFNFRCTNLTVIEMNKNETKSQKSSFDQEKDTKSNIATVDEDKWFIFDSTFVTETVVFTIKNNRDRKLVIKSIYIIDNKRESQLQLIDPPYGHSFTINPLGKQEIKFEITTKYYGEFRDYFVIIFEGFKIKRSIEINVCENAKDAEMLKIRKDRDEYSIPQTFNTRLCFMRSRHYANQVWSSNKNSQIIPGAGFRQKRRFVHVRIAQYDVPQLLCSEYLKGNSKKEMEDSIYDLIPCLRNELNYENYSRRFQGLIFLEEIQYFVIFRKFDRERAHFQREGEYLTLIIEDLAERRPSLVLGDSVRCINPWEEDSQNSKSYEGVIHKVGRDRIYVKFNPTFQQKYNGEDYRLEFHFSRFNFRKQHHAVTHVGKKMGEQFLFPSKLNLNEKLQLDVELNGNGNLVMKNNGKILNWFNSSLNIVQKQAIKNILRKETKNMPYIIFGPPGTGKTITLVELILQLLDNLSSARIIVTTPSNSAADLLSTRLIESGFLKVGEFMRLVSQNQIERDLIPEHLKPYCGTIDIAIDGTCKDTMVVTDSGLKLKCQMKFLGRHRLTISTCSTMGSYIQLGFPENHFTHVLVDESGQCSEPDIMIPISLVSANYSQVVITGDPKQLSSIVCSNFCKSNGLQTSFLERIITRGPYRKDNMRFPQTSGYDPRLVTKLLYNYRAIPSIMHIYNKLFYDSELLPMISNKDSKEAESLRKFDAVHEMFKSNKRSKVHGAFFYGIISNNEQEIDSPSWYNVIEAKNVFMTVVQFYRNGLLAKNLGIITPYIKQVKHLRTLFNAADISMPKIGTVEEFQGQERDVILLTTVRSTTSLIKSDLTYSLGFVKCPRRMNVAISRARYLVVVFGNPHVLMYDPSWRVYIKYCIKKDAYKGCQPPEVLVNELDTKKLMNENNELENDVDFMHEKSLIEQLIENNVANEKSPLDDDVATESKDEITDKCLPKVTPKHMNGNDKIRHIKEQENETNFMEKEQQQQLTIAINKCQANGHIQNVKETENLYYKVAENEEVTVQEIAEVNKSLDKCQLLKTPEAAANQSKEKTFFIKSPMGIIKTSSPIRDDAKSDNSIEKTATENETIDSDVVNKNDDRNNRIKLIYENDSYDNNDSSNQIEKFKKSSTINKTRVDQQDFKENLCESDSEEQWY